MARPNGCDPTGCSRGGALHPLVSEALQSDPSRIDTSALEKSVTKTVPVLVSATASSGDRPTAMVGKGPAQPAVSVPLQVAPLITDTVPGASPSALLTT